MGEGASTQHERAAGGGTVTSAASAAGASGPGRAGESTAAQHGRAAGGVATLAGVGGLAGEGGWGVLDAEVDARTPSPAQRAASRAQGRALLRAARTTWPGNGELDALTEAVAAPHHAVVLGAAAAAADATPRQAATVAAYQAVTGPASAAVRLLGLDPLAVHRLLAELAPEVDATAGRAAEAGANEWARLPALSAPLLDLHAELHVRADLRLFES
ncbi:urease accessory protein UreF [Actinomadura barringtoniae]|uniref:Urease accessory protein UreF n=1 Tax=Actinomadura barringtoniae TaxID=1427535 RepID=A0A939P6P4_9ACTN|nr:urease accessory protein UreF [Actinomadura barringtoniae]